MAAANQQAMTTNSLHAKDGNYSVDVMVRCGTAAAYQAWCVWAKAIHPACCEHRPLQARCSCMARPRGARSAAERHPAARCLSARSSAMLQQSSPPQLQRALLHVHDAVATSSSQRPGVFQLPFFVGGSAPSSRGS